MFSWPKQLSSSWSKSYLWHVLLIYTFWFTTWFHICYIIVLLPSVSKNWLRRSTVIQNHVTVFIPHSSVSCCSHLYHITSHMYYHIVTYWYHYASQDTVRMKKPEKGKWCHFHHNSFFCCETLLMLLYFCNTGVNIKGAVHPKMKAYCLLL